MHRLIREFAVGGVVFLVVALIATLTASFAPWLAYYIGAPADFIREVLSISYFACLPCGLALAYVTALYAIGRVGVVQPLKFLLVLAVIPPMAMNRWTSGPLVEFTGVALALTFTSALLIGWRTRRYLLG